MTKTWLSETERRVWYCTYNRLQSALLPMDASVRMIIAPRVIQTVGRKRSAFRFRTRTAALARVIPRRAR